MGGEAGDKIRQVTERATLFRITSNAMINVSHLDRRKLQSCPNVVLRFPPMFYVPCLVQTYEQPTYPSPHQACRDFLALAQSHSKHWQKALQGERDQRMRLEQTLEQLAKQHNHLERAFRGATVLPPSLSNPDIDSKGNVLPNPRLTFLSSISPDCSARGMC